MVGLMFWRAIIVTKLDGTWNSALMGRVHRRVAVARHRAIF